MSERFALRFIIHFLLLDLLQFFRDRLLGGLDLVITNYVLVLHDVLLRLAITLLT